MSKQRWVGCCYKTMGQEESQIQAQSYWVPSCKELSLWELFVGNAHNNPLLEISRETNYQKRLSPEMSMFFPIPHWYLSLHNVQDDCLLCSLRRKKKNPWLCVRSALVLFLICYFRIWNNISQESTFNFLFVLCSFGAGTREVVHSQGILPRGKHPFKLRKKIPILCAWFWLSCDT